MDHGRQGPLGLEKGLENREGQNNCFLNVGIQSLWHLLPFTSRFANCERHRHQAHCVFCALKVLLANFEFCEEAVLPPQVLREALDALYQGEGKFKLGQIEDAAETLEAILDNLHECMVPDEPEAQGSDSNLRAGCQPPCVAHTVFGIEVLEQIACPQCQGDFEPLISCPWIYYVYNRDIRRLKDLHGDLPFDKILFNIAKQDRRPCPNESCKQPSPVNRYLLKEPEIFTLGLVWESDVPSPSMIGEALSSISTTISLDQIFTGGCSSRRYNLSGLICYYGKHYDAYFYNKPRRLWIVFDDATVKEVGPTFEDVIHKCKLGHFQPSILFYEVAELHQPGRVMEMSKPMPVPATHVSKQEDIKDPETRKHYKRIKRLLKDCLTDVKGLTDIVLTTPPLHIDVEILWLTTSSLSANIKELVEVLDMRPATRVSQFSVEVDGAELDPLGRLQDLNAQLKRQAEMLLRRTQAYQVAVKTIKDQQLPVLANDMNEVETLLETLQNLKNIFFAMENERKSSKIVATEKREHLRSLGPSLTLPSLASSPSTSLGQSSRAQSDNLNQHQLIPFSSFPASPIGLAPLPLFHGPGMLSESPSAPPAPLFSFSPPSSPHRPNQPRFRFTSSFDWDLSGPGY